MTPTDGPVARMGARARDEGKAAVKTEGGLNLVIKTPSRFADCIWPRTDVLTQIAYFPTYPNKKRMK